ncbi:MAG: protein translocase subunit SecF [Acidobacteria bacterium]|nr:protein translocase subunit SecF [Acidobacteriota bacterium]
MEIFKNTNFDFLGKQKGFIALSLVLLAAGLASLILTGGPRYGIDFKGGTVTTIRFANDPDEDKIRKALGAKISGEVQVQPVTGQNEVMVSTELKTEAELESAAKTVIDTLYDTYHPGQKKENDFHAMGTDKLGTVLSGLLGANSVSLPEEDVKKMAAAMIDYRDTPPRSGLIKSFDELSAVPGATPSVIAAMKKELNLAPFGLRGFDMVGPKMGEELRWQAIYVTLGALAGMLVYIWFRFEWYYGVAAVLAVFHDTLVTIGLFSIFNKEITITVIAALLTLVGYSMNDTIVTFDRVRENLKLNRKMAFADLVNASINQTLSRTILTSGLTFLSVLALWLFGGEVLNGFSFALVVGIIVGTYSSIFIASPILIWCTNWIESRKKAAAPVANQAAPKENNRDAVTRGNAGGGAQAKKAAGAVKAK